MSMDSNDDRHTDAPLTDFEKFAFDHAQHRHCHFCNGCILDPLVQKMKTVYCIGCRVKLRGFQVEGA